MSSMLPVQILPYTKEQSSQIRQFCLSSVEEKYSCHYNRSWAYDIDSLASSDTLYDPNQGGMFFVALSGTEIIGTGGIRKLSTSPDLAERFKNRYYHPQEVGLLNRVSVRKDFRGKGIGSQITLRIISFAQEWGYAVIYLNASSKPKVFPFWEKQGFREFDREDDSFGTLHMEYTLL